MTDEEIAKRLRQKDWDVFDYIMAQYNKLLWVVVGNVMDKAGTAEDIEDCISEVYIKLLKNPAHYDPRKGSLKSFLVRVAKNLAIDRYRRISKQRGAVTDIQACESMRDEGDPLNALLAKANREHVIDAVDNLKEPTREIVIRRYFFNETVRVIAQKMGMKSKEIENKLYQGKLKLKTIFADKESL